MTSSASALARPVRLSVAPATARRQMAALLHDEGWPGDTDGIVLALHEALVNAGRHGGGARRAEASVKGSEVVVVVSDRGAGFDPRPYVGRSPDPMAERGRGLWLISHLASACEVRRTTDGTDMIMRFARP